MLTREELDELEDSYSRSDAGYAQSILKLIQHIRSLESQAAPGNSCPCELTTPCSYACTCANPLMSGGCQRCCKYGSPEQQLKAAESIAARLAAPGKVVAGEGIKKKILDAAESYADATYVEGRGGSESSETYKAELKKAVAEVTELAAPGKIASAIADQIIRERAECYEHKEYALEIAAALIAAATQPQKGKG